MARIRTIKPEFFRHEVLQDLEADNPGSHTMLVFAGLWGHCDKAGRFEWKPRMLKLDILPFLDFDMERSLLLLSGVGLVRRYESGGKQYGEIISFGKHQRINGKEAQEPEKHPAPPEELHSNALGSNGEALGKKQGSAGEHGVKNGHLAHPDGALRGNDEENDAFRAEPSNHTAFNEGSNGEATGKQQRSQEGKGREEEGKRKGMDITASPSVAATQKKKAQGDNETALQAACKETFRSYQAAYAGRYGEPHVDNAKVRSQIKQFVQRIGFDESPLVAEWFVSHPGAKYVSAMHGVGALLIDAEKLRTEWATGRTMTTTAARQSDRRGAMASAVQNLLAECGGGA